MFLIKKVAAHFDNKITACQKKSIDDQERNLLLRTQQGPLRGPL